MNASSSCSLFAFSALINDFNCDEIFLDSIPDTCINANEQNYDCDKRTVSKVSELVPANFFSVINELGSFFLGLFNLSFKFFFFRERLSHI